MKKCLVLMLLGLLSSGGMAQKENGMIYSEHHAIAKVRASWDAFVRNDKDAFCSFYADTVVVIVNDGTPSVMARKELGGYIDFWSRVANKKATPPIGVSPDALSYKNNELWVQDWMVLTGRDTLSGINMNLPFHALFRFDSKGKINVVMEYFDTSQTKALLAADRIRENGKVYINHPYINTVRKMVNAFCDEDLTTYLSFFADNFTIWDSTMSLEQSRSKTQEAEYAKSTFESFKNIHFKQWGYPDCVYYDQEDQYTVYSWWIMSCENEGTGNLMTMPVFMSHTFDKEGKIVSEADWFSSNHVK